MKMFNNLIGRFFDNFHKNSTVEIFKFRCRQAAARYCPTTSKLEISLNETSYVKTVPFPPVEFDPVLISYDALKSCIGKSLYQLVNVCGVLTGLSPIQSLERKRDNASISKRSARL